MNRSQHNQLILLKIQAQMSETSFRSTDSKYQISYVKLSLSKCDILLMRKFRRQAHPSTVIRMTGF